MLGSIGFRAFFRFAGFDAEKGTRCAVSFFVWERIGQEQNALSGCTKSIVQEQNDSRTVAPKRLIQLSAAGEVQSCRDRLCRVRCFCCKEKIVANVPPERFQNQRTASGTQGGAVLFAPPSKSYRFSHPPAPCAKSMAQGISPSADGDSEGCSPSKNTSPTALSWISLTDSTIPFLFVPARCFLQFALVFPCNLCISHNFKGEIRFSVCTFLQTTT